MTSVKRSDGGRKFRLGAVLPVLMFILASLSPLIMHGSKLRPESRRGTHDACNTDTGSRAWNWTYEQPWGQFGRHPHAQWQHASFTVPNGGPAGWHRSSDVTRLREPSTEPWGQLGGCSRRWTSSDACTAPSLPTFSASITAPAGSAMNAAQNEDLFGVHRSHT